MKSILCIVTAAVFLTAATTALPAAESTATEQTQTETERDRTFEESKLKRGEGFDKGIGFLNPSFGIRTGFGATTIITDAYDAVFGFSPSLSVLGGFELVRVNRFSIGFSAFVGYSYDMFWLPDEATGMEDGMMRAHTLRYGADIEMMAANFVRFGIGTELIYYIDGTVDYWFGTVPFDDEQKGHSIMINAFGGIEPRLGETLTMPIIARFQVDLGSISDPMALPLIPRLEIGLRWYPTRRNEKGDTK